MVTWESIRWIGRNIVRSTEKHFTTQSRLLTPLEEKVFENIEGKRRKCWSPAFSPLPTMFSSLSNPNFSFCVTIILLSANALNLDLSKILSFGKGLKEFQESMDRCTGRRDVTEILLKTALNTLQSIDH